MGRAGLERAYSPKVWLAMRYGLRGRYTYRSIAHSALVSFTPGGKLPTPEQMNVSPAMFLYRYSISSEHNSGRRKWEAMKFGLEVHSNGEICVGVLCILGTCPRPSLDSAPAQRRQQQSSRS